MSVNARCTRVWEGERADALEILRLNEIRGVLDVSTRIGSGKCLGTAVGLESDALQLLWVGFKAEAVRYWAVIRDLALAAFRDDESYLYVDPDGRRSFAHYTEFRLASTAEWIRGESRGTEYVERMFTYLGEVLASVPSPDSDEVLARYCLHLAENARYREIDEARTATPKNEWRHILELCRIAARDVCSQGQAQPATLREWQRFFLAKVDCAKYRRPYDPKYAPHEITALARATASLFGVSDPVAILEGVRWPEKIVGDASL